jgi:hypothetical protein
MIYNQVSPLYAKLLTDKLNLSYSEQNKEIKKELAENIISQGIFSFIINTWIGVNQKAFLGIII